jgi:hypothetical protein
MTKHRGSRGKGKRGGSGNYTSASSYGGYVNGSGNSQFERTFDQTGQYANRMGTDYVGAQGQWSNPTGQPTPQNLALIQSAGRRRGSRGRRGGLWGSVINQAIVPFSILAAQQTYRKRRGGKRTRKSMGGKRSRRHH